MKCAFPSMKPGGFTLVEAILVITIGIVLVTSGTVLFKQYRQSVGDSVAFDRVNGLQSVVESVYAQQQSMPGQSVTGTYPNITAVANMWQAKRPQDYNMSPWGGLAVTGIGGTPVASYMAGGQSPAQSVPTPAPGDNGVLYYWTAPATAGPAIVSANDAAGGVSTPVYFLNYLVAIVSNTYVNGAPAYVFVRSAQANPGGSPTSLSGGVAGSAAPPFLY